MSRTFFRIEECNPFQEWHEHGSTATLSEALPWAKTIARRQNVTVRILNSEGDVIAILEP
jgi:hypothetical protein